jgi:hypothetical protein
MSFERVDYEAFSVHYFQALPAVASFKHTYFYAVACKLHRVSSAYGKHEEMDDRIITK